MKLSAKVERITPTKAKQALADNNLNRKIKRPLVARYATEIAQGNWALTGEPVIFNGNTLLNGQHRLLACVEAEKPFETLVVRGVDPVHFAKMDSGSRRSAGDVLSIKGFSSGNQIAAAVRVIAALHEVEQGAPLTRIRWHKGMTHQEILDFVSENADSLYECASVVLTREARAILKPPSAFIALHFFLRNQNESRADEFFMALGQGENLEGGSPIHRLRSLLIQDATSPKRSRVHWKIAVTIKGWNAWMEGRRPRSFEFSENETWPQVATRKFRAKNK